MDYFKEKISKTKMFVDLQNDVTAKDIKLALKEGFQSIEHVKRYTTTGMATDQGKTSNVNALGIISELSNTKYLILELQHFVYLILLLLLELLQEGM